MYIPPTCREFCISFPLLPHERTATLLSSSSSRCTNSANLHSFCSFDRKTHCLIFFYTEEIPANFPSVAVRNTAPLGLSLVFICAILCAKSRGQPTAQLQKTDISPAKKIHNFSLSLNRAEFSVAIPLAYKKFCTHFPPSSHKNPAHLNSLEQNPAHLHSLKRNLAHLYTLDRNRILFCIQISRPFSSTLSTARIQVKSNPLSPGKALIVCEELSWVIVLIARSQ